MKALRRRVDSGRLAVPATYPGEAPVGRPVPRDAETEPAPLGFSVARLDGREWLVRPDGYVARPVARGVAAAVDAERGYPRVGVGD